ncbi:floral homeotic protein AGAMOUS-like [Apium graveolens]|uniref:floral homeotic protein AGAMOUS-like n=1 Tax=Apium graveolens TaxID=4045 RepID=UPI003D78C353
MELSQGNWRASTLSLSFSITSKKPRDYVGILPKYSRTTGQLDNRNMMGEAINSLNVKDLKNLETKLEKGLNKIRSKKTELLFAEVEYMQKRVT